MYTYYQNTHTCTHSHILPKHPHMHTLTHITKTPTRAHTHTYYQNTHTCTHSHILPKHPHMHTLTHITKTPTHAHTHTLQNKLNQPQHKETTTVFTITLRHTTLGRTSLDEWSARRRDLYLITHNTYKRQKYMPPARFDPAIPASEWPQTHALDRAATRICSNVYWM